MCLSHYLKLWADAYDYDGETKGGYIPLTFKCLYITSNFTIAELFKDLAPQTIEAI